MHPFFKQAKRKDYLIKTVLACVPPLDQRPHRKTGFKEVTIEHTAQWDFDTTADDDIKPFIAPTQKQQQHISFGNIVGRHGDLPSPAPSESDVLVRKSRFVVEEGSNISLDKDDTTVSSQRSLSPSNISFISRETIPSNTATTVFPNDPTEIHNWQTSMGLGLGISSASTAIAASLQQPQENVQVKKGRFSVNHQSAPASIRTANISTDLKTEQTPILPPESASDLRSMPMSRVISNDSMKGGNISIFVVKIITFYIYLGCFFFFQNVNRDLKYSTYHLLHLLTPSIDMNLWHEKRLFNISVLCLVSLWALEKLAAFRLRRKMPMVKYRK